MDPATELNSDGKTDLQTSVQSDEIQNKLSQIVGELETEENIDKLARIMEAEWDALEPDSETPDLSFKKFEEKLKSAENQ